MSSMWVLGRNFFISRYLKLRPNFGLKGTWQKQDYVIISQGGTIPSIGEDQNKLDYWGVGIRAGFDTTWHLTRCYSILGNVAVAGLWERFDVDRILRNYPVDPAAAAPQTLQDLENKIDTIKPVLELFIGARWETWFCCDRYHVAADAGWEIQWWSNQNQFFTPVLESKLGDLYFQGLTARIRLDF